MSAGKTHLQDVDTDEEVPTWAKSLTNAFRSNKESLNAKIEEINLAIQNLSREFKAVKHRVANAEKCISDLEDDLVKENVLVKELSKQVSMLYHRVEETSE